MTDKESTYKKITEPVVRFDEQFDSYKNATYNETLTKRDFIDPFFKALGWDIDNEQGNGKSRLLDFLLYRCPYLFLLFLPFHSHRCRSKLRYWIASLRCSGRISSQFVRSAIVRETFKIRS